MQAIERLRTWNTLELGIGAAGLLALCFAVFFFVLTLSTPAIEDQAFRQTQTAISIDYMLKEGSIVEYQTPVLGRPWSVPFEAPLYQMIVASVVAVTGASIDSAGRAVSFVFFLGTLLFCTLTLRLLFPADRAVSLIFVLLMLTSPIYLYMGRVVLIETTALFFAAAWLYYATRALLEERLWLAAVAAPFCILAALTKATTWPAFVVAFGAIWLHRAISRRTLDVRLTAAVGMGVLLAFVATIAWTSFADGIKVAGPITKYETSAALSRWNFGTWADRFGARFWRDLLPTRMLPDVLGYAWLLPFIAGTHLVLRGRYFAAAWWCAFLFLLPLLIFTNLHLVHDYYQTSNGLFLIAFAAIGLGGLIVQGHPRAAALLCVALIVGQMAQFATRQYRLATRDVSGEPVQLAAYFVKEHHRPGTALIVFGVDWNPQVHYYSGMKGLAVPVWVPKDTLESVIKDPTELLGMPLGAVVACIPVFPEDRGDLKVLTDEFIAQTASIAKRTQQFGRCTAYVL